MNQTEKFVNKLLKEISVIKDEEVAKELALITIKRIVECGMVIRQNNENKEDM